MIRIGINGFGRMGRLAFRVAWGLTDVSVVHVNEIKGGAATAAHLLEFDSVHGRWSKSIHADGQALTVEGRRIAFTAEPKPNEVPWESSNVDIVLECSGKLLTPEVLQLFFERGVHKVIVAAPVKQGALNIVMGVNDQLYSPGEHHIVTAASCTTNCLAPVVKVIHEGIGIRHGVITTIHDVTNTQTIVDLPHKDLRRARSALMSLIPTTTGSATAIGLIYPELQGKLNGVAIRVPLLNASLTDCVFEVARSTSATEVNQLFKQAAGTTLRGILAYEERPLVSIDFLNDPHSAIIDALSTMVIDGTQVKVLAWYDNEWGYVNRMVELARKIAADLTQDATAHRDPLFPVNNIRSYALVTGAYWGFTITDGALRMLVVLHFYKLGYDSISIAFLFLFYEFFGIVTNLCGGWIAARSGVKVTLYGGLVLQIFALLMLAFLNPQWERSISVAYVMGAQALSGIAKDLTKMSAKSAIKVIVPDGNDGMLFKWVARLTGSKNALKGVGFFVGGALLAAFGFAGALMGMAAALVAVLLATVAFLSGDLGRSKKKVKFTSILSKSSEINWLSAARLFLFASRDVWFVVGLPVFLSQLGWSFYAVGAFLALWVIGYGFIQAAVPEILRTVGRGETVDGAAARLWAFVLLVVPIGLAAMLRLGANPGFTLILGLAAFAVIFAINSAVHSYLVLAYTDEDSVALNVGFYYMANACGRLLGTLLSGVVFQFAGFQGCLWGSAALVLIAAALSLNLPCGRAVSLAGADVGGSD